MYLTGMRTGELIKMKWCDISDVRTGSEFEKKFNKMINIPQENSKLGDLEMLQHQLKNT